MPAKDTRTAYYFQSWRPKNAPEVSTPTDHGPYDSLDKMLRAASTYEIDNPDSFIGERYSQQERWIPEEEYYEGQLIKSGYWEGVDNTLTAYDSRGAIIFTEKPELTKDPYK